MKRGQRPRRARPVVLTERDYQVLLFLGLSGYASTEQVAREFFPSVDRCRRRVRALFEAGYLSVTIAASNTGNLLSLTRPGQAALHTRFADAAEHTRLGGAIRLAGVAHHLGVLDARQYLTALCGAHGHELREWSGPSSRRLQELGLDGLRPDGLVEIWGNGRLVRQAIEFDRGSEPGKVIAGKLTRYAEAFAMEQLDELWLVVAGGRERQERLAQLAMDAGLGDVTRVIPHAHTLARPPAPLPPLVAARRDWAAGPNQADASAAERQGVRPLAQSVPAVDRIPARRAVG